MDSVASKPDDVDIMKRKFCYLLLLFIYLYVKDNDERVFEILKP